MLQMTSADETLRSFFLSETVLIMHGDEKNGCSVDWFYWQTGAINYHLFCQQLIYQPVFMEMLIFLCFPKIDILL